MFHASSSKVCKYDIFLSFRGEDARRTFVSHLYNALEQRGIHAFKNDERLEAGKSISAELLKAIEEARFSVVIFSKSYASSRLCLEELAHIIKCKKELEQIVIPVFYDVSPSDVRHQKPPFADSFSQHEVKYKDDMENVQRWRGMSILKNMLRLNKVLFILNDVNHREQLEFLVGGPEWFGMGSRIILTARAKHLLISHVGDNVYEVQLLSEDEALELFSRHAFREKTPKKDFMELSRQVVKHAGGLPLALKVLGSSFYGRDKKHWRHIVDRLKRIPHKDILGKLRLSFDGLDKDEKELFLDIVFLDIACLTRYDFHLCTELVLRDTGQDFLIDYLIEKSLLSINISNSIMMHNKIREMGENVIREEYDNSRIWLPEEVCDLFKGKLVSNILQQWLMLLLPKFANDERLETGKSISEELLKAIQESKFAIVIFSKSYALSRWCLEELAHIIKCKKELEQIVIPVFYDVSPSDVRHQHPPFADSFLQHEEKCKDDMEKVQRWTGAFADEAECIKKLVDDIFPKSLQIISPFPERLVGIKSQVEKVTSLLDMESNDVRSIGIWGMGGIGKTEIANILHQRYRHRFEADCFLGDIGKLHQKIGLTWLQQAIICKLLGEKLTLTSEHEGMNILKNMLRWKTVLFILDDVNHQEQWEFLVGGTEWFGRGSRIILTARDKHLLISHVGDNVYEVQLLSEDEALELFSRHAFREKSPKEDFMELSRQVVNHAGGLPLALKVLGSSFYGRDKKHWRHIIDQLKRIPHKDILGKARLSFDGLDKDEKELFLDIVFLDIACLTRYDFHLCVELVLRDTGQDFLIDYLIEKSLLSINISNRIVMHNMIREMGKNVIQEECDNSRIWLPEEVCDLFKGKLKLSNLKHLDLMDSCELRKTTNFGDMPNLETLNLHGCVNLEEVHPSFRHCRLLTYLSLESCRKLKKLPKVVCVESLETLNLIECTSLEEFPEICGDMPRLSILYVNSPWIRSLPPSFSSLRNLQLIECEVLESIPDTSQNLRNLSISGCNKVATLPNSLFESQQLGCLGIYRCSGLVKLPISLGVQKKLCLLEIDGCENLKKLPSSIQMKSLQKLKISNSPKLDTFPEIDGDMHYLTQLTLNSTGIREVPSSIGHLRGLEYLYLSGCEELLSLPDSLCNLMKLQCLYLDRCKKLEKLPENIGDLQDLHILDASETAISQPPPSITKLGKLWKLRFSHEQQFQHSSSFVLNQVSGLSSLTSLDLNNHNILSGLPEDLGSLHSLENLNVSGSNISCLPKSFKGLLHLQHLNVQFCQNLNELPGELPPNLRELFSDYHLALKSSKNLVICCLKLCRLAISDYGTVSSEQVNVFLQHFLRACIQCDFHQRACFIISFPGVRIPELFDYDRFINQNEISIALYASWYTDKFMGFWISYGPTELDTRLEATLVCKSDPERKYSLEYNYIPEYSREEELCWGIRLEYEKEAMSDAKQYSSTMSHASSSKICKYDIFLSFRGEDTRRTFVSHLYKALEQRGIRTFKDDERLETGKSISDELLKAIQEARFAVVIFSKSYASSRWCLEELAHIIKCKKELEQIVIPVFYDVSPSDVRHQNPPIAGSFSQHEVKYKDDMEKVQRWRDAFMEAGKISGYHLLNFKDEAECIKKLVDDIFPKSLQIISPFPESLVGMKYQVEKVSSLLDMESNDVRSIGIWGMGGIGKTEIANVLHQRYRHQFEADCFLGDVGELHQKNGLTWLQQVVISKLLGKEMPLTSKHEGMNILKKILCQKKVLFILDDVYHREQLEFLVGGTEWFGKGSRIILTARDKHLLISHVGDNVYEVQLLSKNEALELFSRHAFREKSPKEDFLELSRQVVKYAGRLPLALKVLGSSFYRQDKKHWRHIIGRLKRIPHKDILGKLRLSFDGLDKDEKELFLDIAFLQIAGLSECDFHLCVESVLRDPSRDFLVDCLVKKSLLSIQLNNIIVMHNMIREMGENVIREEYANSRIWLPEEVCDLFTGKLIAEKVESLYIPNDYYYEDDFVDYSNIFKRMQSLKILIVGDRTFSSNCAITYLPSSLRFINWRLYPSISLPENFEPSQLVVLRLCRSRLVELWPTTKKFSNLKHLDLRDSCELTKTPNFGDIPNLEELYLSGCVNLEEVHSSLGHCRMLTYLCLHTCIKLKKLPKFVCMESLEYLNLYDCTSLEEFPEICGDMRHLSILSLGSPWIRSLPPSLSGLRELYLDDCEILESIPETIQNLSDLSILGCNKLATLPNSLFESQQLQCLEIHQCSGLVELPSSLGVQKNLCRLEIERCENLKKLPSSIQMKSLQQLMISNSPKLDTFPEIKGYMHYLNNLNLSSIGIREVPSSIGNLLSLTQLYLKGCEDLVSLPDSLCNLMNLQRLFLNRCKRLEKLPENIGDLQELVELDARDTALSQPPSSITKLGKLWKLRFSHEKQLQYSSSFVLHQVSGLSTLGELHLSNLNILGGLPEDLGCLHSLEKLDVSGSNISCFPKSFKGLLHLQHLNVQFCQNLNELPGEPPPNLEELFADYHLALQSIKDLLINCLKLYKIGISNSGTVSSEQVNVFLQHFLRTCIQCDFRQRDYFVIFFPDQDRILELFNNDRFINQEKMSIDLYPSWHTDKFMGFWICYSPAGQYTGLEATLVCKSDPERKYSLKYNSIHRYSRFKDPFICCVYIPFETLWNGEGNKEGKNPNDYYMLEVSDLYRKWEELYCWGIRLVYEKDAMSDTGHPKKKRKQ
ncbi:hypothetical protein H5410_063603 [Solanum commersonii]|uniref:ADP-ribosyl cyclase/cyclic ADP-ribose hydrolase n=1 Tax=Solanum commersonii TaxID=4109 RepID=A0A9J5WEC4_SOLCO|nr:hypothetical protein H5410_063603 [Solanum commersonii]